MEFFSGLRLLLLEQTCPTARTLMARLLPLLLLALVGLSLATPIFQEDFDAGWEKRWVHSTSKDKEGTAGKFKSGASDWPLSANDKGTVSDLPLMCWWLPCALSR